MGTKERARITKTARSRQAVAAENTSEERKETMQAPAHEIDREGERDQYTNGYGFIHKCHTRLRRWNKRAPLSECRRRDEFYLGAVWLTIL
jgi:hypothetical protein